MSCIFVVPTPIGNLKDITLRALECLKTVDCIYAEDTRITKKLLSHYTIKKPMYTYHQHNEHKITTTLINNILNNNLNVAIVSDAGTPLISDPGYLLINNAKKAGIEIICLPGATAFVPALVQSGFSTDEFYFAGFLPHKKGRQKRLDMLLQISSTIVLYESPHRVIKLLNELNDKIKETRMLSISREITKIHEENKRGTAKELLDYFTQNKIKGEFVVLIDKPSKNKLNV